MKMKKYDSINVIPFIDIMLVLLVIVLTTATFVARGIIPLELASAKSSKTQQNDEKILHITIDKNGAIFFEKEKIDRSDITLHLNKYNSNQVIYIACDKEMEYENFIYLLDHLKSKNFTNLHIMTKK